MESILEYSATKNSDYVFYFVMGSIAVVLSIVLLSLLFCRKKTIVKKKAHHDLKLVKELSAARGHLRVAEEYYGRKLYTQAIEEAKKVLAVYPMVKEAYTVIGRSFLFTGHFNEALYNLLKSLEIDEQQPDIYVDIGKCNFELALFDVAQKSFLNALKYNSKHDEAHYYLGYIYGEINSDYNNALKFLEKYTLLVPFSPRIKEVKTLISKYKKLANHKVLYNEQ